MAITDFLFNGSPPPSVTTYGSSTANLPTWYSDYTQGLLAKANAVAAEPYQAYSGPRVADFNSDQQTAFQNTRDNVGAYQPGVDMGLGTAAAAAGANPVGAAQPYADMAMQSAPSVVNDYMSPYVDNVVNRIGQLAGRNLNENLMPAIGDDFTKAGQFGGSRQTEMTGRALRDTQESALAQQNQALNTGYGQAMTAAQGDLSRYGSVGQVMGNLASANQSNMTNAANAMGTLSSTGQQMGLKDAAALEAIGQTQQNLDQTNYNTAYNDFTEQRAYPQQQIGFMSDVVRGMNMPTSTTTTNTAPAANYSPSPLATLASGLGGLASVFGTNKAKGGLVKAKRSPARGALQMARA